MAGFKGKYEHAVDDKGRVNLPAKIRKNLAPEALDSFVITRGYDGCLDLYPLDVWNIFEDQLRTKTNRHVGEDLQYIRTLMMWAQDTSLDKQARITIPQDLSDFAGITSNVVIIGALDKIEIWSPEKFREYHELHATQSYEELAARVLGDM